MLLETVQKGTDYQRRQDPTSWPLSDPQHQFHSAPEPERLFSGGNNSGKTWCGVREARMFAEGNHPFKDIKAPNYGWIVNLTFKASEEIAEPYIGVGMDDPGITPIWKRDEGIWRAAKRTLELPNGSSVGLRSTEAGDKVFQGPKRRWIMFDEEPPEDIYRECLARVIPGEPIDIWITATPTQGMSWTYDQFVLNPETGRHFIVYAEVGSNPSITPSQVREIEERLKFDPKAAARLLGQFVAIGENPAFPYDPLVVWLERARDVWKSQTGYLNIDGNYELSPDGDLRVWEMPQAGVEYVIGGDISEGLPKGAWSVGCILRLPDRTQVAEWRGKIPPIRFGSVLARLGRMYNTAYLVPEANNHGIATISHLVNEENYRNVYQRMAVDRDGSPGLDAAWGFYTSGRTKYEIEQLLFDACVTGSWEPRSETLIREMMGASRDSSDLLVPGRGMWLDCTMAAGLALVGCRRNMHAEFPRNSTPQDSIARLRERMAEMEANRTRAAEAAEWRY